MSGYLNQIRQALHCFVLLLLIVAFPQTIFAEPFELDETPPTADLEHFPGGSDMEVWETMFNETMKAFDGNKEIGEEIAELYGLKGTKWNGQRYIAPEGELDVTDFVEGRLAYIEDTLKMINPVTFFKCFSAKLVLSPTYNAICNASCPYIPYCNNRGYVFEYWWPENEAETENFAESILNPLFPPGGMPRKDLQRKVLKSLSMKLLSTAVESQIHSRGSGLDQEPDDAEFPPGLRDDPNLGQSHFAGLLPMDQTLNLEAHTFRTKLAVAVAKKRPKGFSRFLGYKLHRNCFYNALPMEPPYKEVINGWTEGFPYNLFWRIPEFSMLLNPVLYKAAAPASVPLSQLGSISNFPRQDSCASFRAKLWQHPYADLKNALDIIPNFDLLKYLVCFKGGGQLYPVTGNLMGHFDPLRANAYLARRAFYLFSSKSPFLTRTLLQGRFRMNVYSDMVDKMQRVYPTKHRLTGSQCFRTSDIPFPASIPNLVSSAIPNYTENDINFPRDLVREEHKGNIRHVYWNKRIACMCRCFGIPSGCWSMDSGDDFLSIPRGRIPLVLPPGVPYPFVGLGDLLF